MNKASSTPAWYVFYCKSRTEKKLSEQLQLKGFEPFLPLVKTKRVWSDRIKEVTLPLFPNYIFVACTSAQVPQVLGFTHVVGAVRHNGSWATLRDQEKAHIEQVLISGFPFELQETKVEEGDLVEITTGPLKSIQGRVLHQQGPTRVAITLEVLNKSILVAISSNEIRKL